MMATFRGTVRGCGDTIASRCGSKESGLRTAACSWEGKVVVELRWDEKRECVMAEVQLLPHFGAGVSKVVYAGPVAPKCWQPERLVRDEA